MLFQRKAKSSKNKVFPLGQVSVEGEDQEGETESKTEGDKKGEEPTKEGGEEDGQSSSRDDPSG